MRRRAVLLILFCAGAGLLRPADAKAAFARGNRLYGQGRYLEALQAYQALAAGRSNWKVLYNSGNACFKLGRFLEAKIYYLQARKLEPQERMIRDNLEIVNRRFKDRIPPAREDFAAQLLRRIGGSFSDVLLFALALASSLAANACLCLLLLGRRSRILVYGLAVGLSLFLLFFGIQQLRLSGRRAVESAVQLREGAELRSGPGAGQTVLFKVNPGLELRILQRQGDWCEVAASAQVAGWIETGNLRFI